MAPGGDSEKFVDALEGEAHLAIAFYKTFAEGFAPVFLGLGHLHFVAAHPGDPFGDLGLMAPGHIADGVEGVFDVDGQIEGVFAGHVAVVEREDDGDFNELRLAFGGRIVRKFGSKGVGDIDHVSDFADRFGNGDVIDVDASEGVGRVGRGEDVVGLEIADFFPEGGEERGGNCKAAIAGHFAAGEAKDAELILADAGGSFLLFEAQAHGFLAGAKVVTGLAIGADEHAGFQFDA